MNSFIKVTLKHGKDQSIRRNHPWVFSGAIQRIDGKPENGDIIEVADIKGETLGFAHYSEGSIAARIFHFGKNIDLENIWEKKISDAFELRMKLGLTGNEATTIYRLDYRYLRQYCRDTMPFFWHVQAPSALCRCFEKSFWRTLSSYLRQEC
jgi:23S rRNA (cytosine1962-C5)-methyltransferase